MNHRQDESKTRILEAAKQCFATYGYNGTSVRKICEIADANLALVSYYFGSKEKLYYTVIKYLYLDTNQKLNQSELIEQPKEALRSFISAFVQLRKHDPQFNMLLRHELSTENPRKESISKIITPYFDHLQNILKIGKEQGVFQYESLHLSTVFIASILVYPSYDSFLLESHAVNSDLDYEINMTIQFILAGLHCQH